MLSSNSTVPKPLTRTHCARNNFCFYKCLADDDLLVCSDKMSLYLEKNLHLLDFWKAVVAWSGVIVPITFSPFEVNLSPFGQIKESPTYLSSWRLMSALMDKKLIGNSFGPHGNQVALLWSHHKWYEAACITWYILDSFISFVLPESSCCHPLIFFLFSL